MQRPEAGVRLVHFRKSEARAVLREGAGELREVLRTRRRGVLRAMVRTGAPPGARRGPESAERRTAWGAAGLWTHPGVAQEGLVGGGSVSALPTSWGLGRSPCFLGSHSVAEHPLCPQQLPSSRFQAPGTPRPASVGGAWGGGRGRRRGLAFPPRTPLRFQ